MNERGKAWMNLFHEWDPRVQTDNTHTHTHREREPFTVGSSSRLKGVRRCELVRPASKSRLKFRIGLELKLKPKLDRTELNCFIRLEGDKSWASNSNLVELLGSPLERIAATLPWASLSKNEVEKSGFSKREHHGERAECACPYLGLCLCMCVYVFVPVSMQSLYLLSLIVTSLREVILVVPVQKLTNGLDREGASQSIE